MMHTTLSTIGSGTPRIPQTLKLSQLQNLCKRHPQLYKADYHAQVCRLQSLCTIVSMAPTGGSDVTSCVVELIQFVAAVWSSSYRDQESDDIVKLVMGLLTDIPSNHTASTSMNPTIHKDIRTACVSALILMRNKGSIPPLTVIQFFFQILPSCQDKPIRERLYKHIVNDIRNINKKGKRDEKVNREVRKILHQLVVHTIPSNNNYSEIKHLQDQDDRMAKYAVDILSTLYRTHTWTDPQSITILGCACRSNHLSVMSKAMKVLLNIEDKMEEDRKRRDDKAGQGCMGEVLDHGHSRKTRSRKRKIAKQLKNRVKLQRQREQSDLFEDEASLFHRHINTKVNHKKLFPAIELLHDPQGLCESIFSRLRKSGSNNMTFQHKRLCINFITRLIGNHELILLPLYPYLRRYMASHQRDVTSILAYVVQGCNSFVPPEEIHGLLHTICGNFITERCTSEQMAVGINACRAICLRAPSALVVDNIDTADEENTTGTTSNVHMDVEAFARDLAGYAKHNDRSVSVAGRSWMNFIREVHPSLLKGKDRGIVGSGLYNMGQKPLRYGESRVETGVKGSELLVEYEMNRKYDNLKRKRQSDDVIPSISECEDRGEALNEKELEDDQEEEIVDEDDGESDNDIEDEETPVDKDVMEEEETESEVISIRGNDDDESDKVPTLIPSKEVHDEEQIQTLNDSIPPPMDVSKMTQDERSQLQLEIASSRVFSMSDFTKIRKLVEQEEKARRDPRAAALLKRLKAQGKSWQGLGLNDDETHNNTFHSDSDSDSDSDAIHTKGAVRPNDIMALSKKKRNTKIERLEKVKAGRERFEHKQRAGGSTNIEKNRSKNFVMTKFSYENRKRVVNSKQKMTQKMKHKGVMKHDRKKRRRKV